MIVIPALALLIRRAVKVWRANELARYRLRRRRELGYGWYAVIEAFRRDWTWRLRPVLATEFDTTITEDAEPIALTSEQRELIERWLREIESWN